LAVVARAAKIEKRGFAMNQEIRQTPDWIAATAEYERERAIASRNWMKAPRITAWMKRAVFGVFALPVAAGLAKMAGAPLAWVDRLGDAQSWVWALCLAIVVSQITRGIFLEIKHHRALARAVRAIHPLAGTREALRATAIDEQEDDFARLVAIKALRKDARERLADVSGVSEKEFAAYKNALKEAYKAIDRRIDQQVDQAYRAGLPSPFSNEQALREQSIPVLRSRRAGV